VENEKAEEMKVNTHFAWKAASASFYFCILYTNLWKYLWANHEKVWHYFSML